VGRNEYDACNPSLMQNDGVDKRDTETIYDEALGDRRHGSWKTRRRSVNFLNAFISIKKFNLPS
jgi:hypothetical protein